MKTIIICSLMSLSAFAQNVKITPELIKKFKDSTPINMEEVIQDLELKRWHKNNPKVYKLNNPFYPMTRVQADKVILPPVINGQKAYIDHGDGTVSFYHQKKVYEWFNQTPKHIRDARVCGVKFVDQQKEKYHLQTFNNKEEALKAGYIVTHQNHCGACSALFDLGILLEKRNMVEDGRRCAKRLSLKGSKKCHVKKIELTEYCSEAWAYNATATRNRCMKTCIKEYGLINMILGKFPDVYTNPDGSLKPCILCDELKSGPGYAYATGRTRRSSGIISAIDRAEEELYHLDYRAYYQLFDLEVPK